MYQKPSPYAAANITAGRKLWNRTALVPMQSILVVLFKAHCVKVRCMKGLKTWNVPEDECDAHRAAASVGAQKVHCEHI